MDIKPLGKDISIWLDTTRKTNFPKLTKKLETDAVIVGGGIVGITTAYYLLKRGLKVVLLEKNRIVEKTTGNTTAKVTALQSLIYSRLVKKFGKEIAQIYGQANLESLRLVSKIVTEEKINCDFIEKSAYTFATVAEDRIRVEEEYNTAKMLGLPARFTDELDLPFSAFGAVEFTNQAQFHPRKYLLGIIDLFINDSLQIFEQTEAKEIQGSEVVTEGGNVKADYIISASQLPFFAKDEFKQKMNKFRDYAIAIKTSNLPTGMYIGTGKNYHSLRTHPLIDGEVLIIDGEGHPVDEQELLDPNHYLNLQNWARENFKVLEFIYYWTTYDWGANNRIPYAGLYKNNIYLATGFGGWGMSNGTISSKIISDLILGEENPFKDLYNPNRNERL